jgi:transposase-like protein
VRKCTRFCEAKEALLGPEGLRGRIREMIWTLAEAELNEVLAARRYQRSPERRGYRNGTKLRSITTGLGAAQIELPRARLSRFGISLSSPVNLRRDFRSIKALDGAK